MQNQRGSEVNKDQKETEYEPEIKKAHVNKLGKEQKIAIFVLGIFTFFMLVFVFSDMSGKIKQPIGNYSGEDNAQPGDSNQTNTAGSLGLDNEEHLKNIDTDGDGLSDWDELYIYKTSPYLEDSDSDGYSDGVEVSTGNDPNCPRGKDCGIFLDDKSVEVQNNDIIGDQLNVTNTAPINAIDGEINANEDQLVNILNGEADAGLLRQALLDYGMDKAMLDQISDEELLSEYKNSLQK